MAVENFQYLNSLDPNLPAGPDGLAQGDDHLRGIKATLRNTFPNITGPVTATSAQLSNPFPIGGIINWYGPIAAIPAGWALCNGQTVGRSDGGGTITTPNLLDRFVVCAGSGYGVGAAGGNIAVGGSTSAVGDHGHAAWTDVQGVHSHGGATAGASLSVDQLPPHNHGFSAAHVGSGYGIGLYYQSYAIVAENPGATDVTGSGNPHAHGIVLDGGHGHNIGVGGAGGHAHSVTIPDARPPFYALAFIMKV